MRQALYRKYRPQVFDDVFGQDNIVNILKNQVVNKKIAHAYIFSGSRGTGKTTCAKIFSKAVNCLDPVNGNPCNKCENCLSIMDESTVDVIEMDAASNRRIEDIRQLREKVIYPPTNLKYKVYIIDEAHMITNEGFNALLKIMEEPPSHLIFVLATTEIEKIPDTILSRTQRFEFKRIDRDNIESNIENILAQEGVKMDSQAIASIAAIANGGMRDALSTLDQVLAMDKEEIGVEDLNSLLGIFGLDLKMKYSQAVFERDIEAALSLVYAELDKGKDPHNFIKELINYYRDLMVTKISKKNNILNLEEDTYLMYKDHINRIELERIVNSLDILLEYDNLIKTSDNAKLLLEMATIRMVNFMPKEDLVGQIKALELRIEELESGQVLTERRVYQEKKEPNNRQEIAKSTFKEPGILRVEKEVKKNIAEPVSKTDKKLQAPSQDEEESSSTEPIKDVDKDNFASVVREMILENYPQTSFLFENLKDENYHNEKITYYLTKTGMDISLAMNFFMRDAEVKLSDKLGEKFVIEFKEYKEEGQTKKTKKLSKEEELKKIFPENILKIIK